MTVAVNLHTLLRLVEVEEKRLQSLRTRASGLAGFAGIIVALAAAFLAALAPSLGSRSVSAVGLSSPFRWALFLVFAVALVCLMTAIWLAVHEVIRPARKGKADETASQFPTEDLVCSEAEAPNIGERWLRILRATREQNTRSANALTRGYLALFLGLALVSVEALLVVLYAIGELPD